VLPFYTYNEDGAAKYHGLGLENSASTTVDFEMGHLLHVYGILPSAREFADCLKPAARIPFTPDFRLCGEPGSAGISSTKTQAYDLEFVHTPGVPLPARGRQISSEGQAEFRSTGALADIPPEPSTTASATAPPWNGSSTSTR
jgi:hypothetical protein